MKKSLVMCAIGLMTAALGTEACSKKKGNSASGLAEGASITISGQLAISDSSTTNALNLTEFGFSSASNLTVSDLKVYCVSFAFPPKAGTGNVDASGAFSLNIEANEVAVGCFILNGTDTVASLVFEDSTGTNVDGAAKTDSRLAFSGSTNMGQISVDTATGKAKANVANFKTKTKAFSGNGFDFTGTWKIKATDNLPAGYYTAQPESACPNMNQGGGSGSGSGAPSGTPPTPEQIQACEGPKVDEKIYFQRVAGKRTTDNSDAFALAVWKSKAAFEACGSKIGFDINEAKTRVKVDFSSSGLADGPFVWTQGWEQGWKFNGASSSYPRPKCKPSRYTLSDGKVIEFMKCKGAFVNSSGAIVTPNVYQIDLNTRESGCRDGNGKPAQIQNWDLIQWNAGSEPCVSKLNGLVRECTNTGTYNGGTITCKHTSGFVNASDTPVSAGAGENFEVEKEPAGLCSVIADEVERTQCYGDFYNKNREGQDDKCIADVNLNWAATTAADFLIKGDGPTRAQNQYVFNMLNYTSATTASVRDDRTYFEPMPSDSKDGDSSIVNCKLAESVDIAITKLSETEVLFDLIIQLKAVDKNPICNSMLSNMGGGENGLTQKFLFKADKESN